MSSWVEIFGAFLILLALIIFEIGSATERLIILILALIYWRIIGIQVTINNKKEKK